MRKALVTQNIVKVVCAHSWWCINFQGYESRPDNYKVTAIRFAMRRLWYSNYRKAYSEPENLKANEKGNCAATTINLTFFQQWVYGATTPEGFCQG
jgi:hypothetical protein